MNPLRVDLTIALATEIGLLDGALACVPAPDASEDDLLTVHDPRLIEAVMRASDDPARADPAFGLGTDDDPAFRGMHQASRHVVGASLEAARRVWHGEALHAANIAGGLHHAMPDRASGFCIYNDVAVAIRWLLANGARRVAYVDVDVHHGDGVERIFYSDPDILTISLHESGRYLFPGTGFPEDSGAGAGKGFAVNLPFMPFTWDEPWLEGFNRVVAPVLRRFRPTVLVTQDGCDTHYLDPLAHLAGTTRIWPHVGRTFHELAHELCEGRWLALGGGGYDLFSAVPRAWTLVFAEMIGAELPDELPAAWLDFSRSKGARRAPLSLVDPATQSDEREMDQVCQVVEQVKREIPLLHG
jgi:acetoin utilization protein AcuC